VAASTGRVAAVATGFIGGKPGDAARGYRA
jgi:hypothetical protein